MHYADCFNDALQLLYLLHNDLKCPHTVHEKFWNAHSNLNTGNFMSILSRLSILHKSRTLLLSLFRFVVDKTIPEDYLLWHTYHIKAHDDSKTDAKTNIGTSGSQIGMSTNLQESLDYNDIGSNCMDTKYGSSAINGSGAVKNSFNTSNKQNFMLQSPSQIRANARRTINFTKGVEINQITGFLRSEVSSNAEISTPVSTNTVTQETSVDKDEQVTALDREKKLLEKVRGTYKKVATESIQQFSAGDATVDSLEVDDKSILKPSALKCISESDEEDDDEEEVEDDESIFVRRPASSLVGTVDRIEEDNEDDTSGSSSSISNNNRCDSVGSASELDEDSCRIDNDNSSSAVENDLERLVLEYRAKKDKPAANATQRDNKEIVYDDHESVEKVGNIADSGSSNNKVSNELIVSEEKQDFLRKLVKVYKKLITWEVLTLNLSCLFFYKGKFDHFSGEGIRRSGSRLNG